MPQCYMCDSEATSAEHVPPRCLFPAQKDLPEGMNLRKNLIKVPSCDVHNTQKSGDDEYLLYLLVLNLPANEIAQNQLLTKIDRAIKRNPRLINRMLGGNTPVLTRDTETGEVSETIALQVEDERFDKSIECIARAIYFEHYGEKWPNGIRIRPDFLLVSLDPKYVEKNKLIKQMADLADVIFADKEFYGENPEVFKYQMADGNDKAPLLMRLHFYEGCRTTIFFENNS